MGRLQQLSSIAFALLTTVDGAKWNQYGSSSAACDYTVGAAVRTTSGTVQGHRAPNATQVSEYLGIPYAQPPVGSLRFAPPRAYRSSNNLSGTTFGHDCPANTATVSHLLAPNVYNLLEQLGQTGDVVSEDCLYINVWSKRQQGEVKKPVLVWFYGGGFNTGGTNGPAYSGQFWADTEDVVFVNFNYRVNIFGFPGAPNITQNVGLLDQRLALEWVRNNIAAFGGDVSRIIPFGQSAGAGSIDLYNYAYTKDPIIAGSILQSGTANAFGNKSPAQGASAWNTVATKVGCGSNTTAGLHQLQCMRNVSMASLLAAEKVTGLAGVRGLFGPVIDGKTVFANYTELALNKQFIQKPTIVGNNDYEAGLFILIALGGGLTEPGTYWTQFNLNGFNCPASTAAYVREIAGVPVWRYRYFGMFDNIELPTSTGRAYHGSELLPMFGSSERVTKQDSTWQERSVGAYMRGAWASFARCPESGLTGYGWPTYQSNTSSMAILGRYESAVPSFQGVSGWDKGCPVLYPGNPPNALG